MVCDGPFTETPVKFRKPLVEVPLASMLGESAPVCAVAVRVPNRCGIDALAGGAGEAEARVGSVANTFRRKACRYRKPISTLPPLSTAEMLAARVRALPCRRC